MNTFKINAKRLQQVRKNKKKIAIGLSLIAVGLISALFITEMALRMVPFLRYSNKYYLWPPYLSRLVKIEPGTLPGISGTKRFYINSFGMRGDEPTLQDDLRILAMGASTTECGALGESETWPQLLQNNLNEDLQFKVWVGNAGRRSSTIKDNILHLKYFVPQLGNIDTIILIAGINDFMHYLNIRELQFTSADREPEQWELDKAFFIHPFINQGIKGTATWSLIKKTKISIFGRKNIAQDESEFQAYWTTVRKNRKETLSTLPDLTQALAQYKHNLNVIIDMANQKAMKIILVTQPTLWKENMSTREENLLWFGCVEKEGWRCYSPKAMAQGIERYNKVLLETCKQRNVQCIDLASQLPKDTTIFYDDTHFNENGAKQVAYLIAHHLDDKK